MTAPASPRRGDPLGLPAPGQPLPPSDSTLRGSDRTSPKTSDSLTEPVNPLPIRFGPDGLIPAVIQDADTDAVLMVGFMDESALAATRMTGRTHFWSRSRGKLWRKGETSGHEQIVEEILLNCEQNSLLVTVRQVGVVCHDGYPSCYYRRLEPDNGLTIVRERLFDPSDVYGSDAASQASLAQSSRLLHGAYEYLRDHDLAAVSGTSARLRGDGGGIAGRVADELRELAGALDGSHHHTTLEEDVLLEGTQTLYWLTLAAVHAGITWNRLRPDRALATGHEAFSGSLVAALLRADADRWATPAGNADDISARSHATLALVGQACRVVGISGRALVEADLTDLRAKPYLATYFAAPPGPDTHAAPPTAGSAERSADG